MGSLQDQMLKAGLVTAEQLQEAEGEQRRTRRQARDGERGKRGRAPEARPAKVRVRTRRDGDGAAKRRPRPPAEWKEERNKARRPAPTTGAPVRQPAPRVPMPDDGGPDAEERALNQKIKELLAEHGRNDEAATLPFHFVQGGKVRRVRVTDEQRRELAGGALAIVLFQRRARIVPAPVAEEIHALRSIVFVHRASPDGAAEEGAAKEADAAVASDEDDLYRDFPVPDDLHW